MKLWLPFLCFFMFFPYHNFNSNLTMSCTWNPLQEETDRIQQDLGDLQRSRSDGGTSWPWLTWLHWFLLGEERSDSAVILGIGNPLLDISAEVSQAWDRNSEERFRGVGCVGWFLGLTLEDSSCGTKLNFTKSLSSNSMWLMATRELCSPFDSELGFQAHSTASTGQTLQNTSRLYSLVISLWYPSSHLCRNLQWRQDNPFLECMVARNPSNEC